MLVMFKDQGDFIVHPHQKKQPRSQIIRDALIQEMSGEQKGISDAKALLEQAMAQDAELGPLTKKLDDANTQYKSKVKQATMHLTVPKAKTKAKAKAKACAA